MRINKIVAILVISGLVVPLELPPFILSEALAEESNSIPKNPASVMNITTAMPAVTAVASQQTAQNVVATQNALFSFTGPVTAPASTLAVPASTVTAPAAAVTAPPAAFALVMPAEPPQFDPPPMPVGVPPPLDFNLLIQALQAIYDYYFPPADPPPAPPFDFGIVPDGPDLNDPILPPMDIPLPPLPPPIEDPIVPPPPPVE